MEALTMSPKQFLKMKGITNEVALKKYCDIYIFRQFEGNAHEAFAEALGIEKHEAKGVCYYVSYVNPMLRLLQTMARSSVAHVSLTMSEEGLIQQDARLERMMLEQVQKAMFK